MDLIQKDLMTNYTISDLKQLANHYDLDINKSVKDLIYDIAFYTAGSHNLDLAASTDVSSSAIPIPIPNLEKRGNMLGDPKNLYQAPIYSSIVKTLSLEEMSALCQADKQFAEICRNKLIWREWAKAHNSIKNRMGLTELDYAMDEAMHTQNFMHLEAFLDAVKIDPKDTESWYGTLMIKAADRGDIDMVKLFLKRGVNIHSWDDQVLWRSAAFGKLDMVKFLIENGADPSAKDNFALEVAEAKVAKYLRSLRNGLKK